MGKRTKIKPEIKPLPPSATLACPNPRCSPRRHALFWYVNSKGQKQLSYFCDRVKRRTLDANGNIVTVLKTAMRATTPEIVPLDDIPEKWSKPYAKKQQEKLQAQLQT